MKALGSSSGEWAREDRLGQEGNAQRVLWLALVKEELRRGKMSRREFVGEGGGAEGEVDIGEGGELLTNMAVMVMTLTGELALLCWS